MKPLAVRSIRYLVFFRLFLLGLFMILVLVFMTVAFESAFLNEVMLPLMQTNLYIEGEVGETLWRIFGVSLLPIAFSLAILYAVKRRELRWFFGVLAVEIVISVAGGGFPVIALIILILGALSSTRNYFDQPKSISEKA